MDAFDRAQALGKYVAENGCTVRDAAASFGVSKSTVHKDLTERLPRVDGALFREVRMILDKNKAERHLRGGLATQRKFRNLEKTE